MKNLTVFNHALKNGVTKPLSLILNSIVPLVLVIFANRVGGVFGGSDAANAMVFYLLAFVIMYGAFLMANSIQKDKVEGVLARILAGPITLRSYLIQNFFAAIIPMIVVSALIGLLGFLIHDWGGMLTIGLVIVYIFLSATSIGLSFVWSCLFKDKEASLSGVSLLITLSALLGGFMFPLEVLPDPAYYVGMITPAHWASRAIEQLVLYGEFTQMYWLGLLALAMFTVAFVLYGSKRRLV